MPLTKEQFIKAAGQAYQPSSLSGGTDLYASFRSQLQGDEMLVNRNGQATAIKPSELKSTDIKL